MVYDSINVDFLFSEYSMFQTLTPQIEWEMQKQKKIINFQFKIFSQISQVYLYSKFIKVKFQPSTKVVNDISLYIRLDSSIKVGLIYQKTDDPFAKKIGISIFKDPNMSYDFYTEGSDILDLWVEQLSKVVFLSGFSNHYKSLSYIGRGQFAKVWEVERKTDGIKFAAKCVDKDECFGQVNGRQALYNEIQILRKLNHQNILHLDSVYESQKTTYMILQHIKGETFSQFVRKTRQLSTQCENASKFQKQYKHKIMKSLLKAVNYLHSIGIAHRDLKPGNIIIDSQSYEPCVIDFGMSQQVNKSQLLFQRCGSTGYMAPQIFLEEKVGDLRKCDVFSLGALFYLLLTGESLFAGNSSEDIILETKNSDLKRKISSKLEGYEAQLLISMLHQNPQKRVNAEQALQHDYFIEQMYDNFQSIRKPIDCGSDSSKYSLQARNKQSRFQELFSESIIVLQDKFYPSQLDSISKQKMKIRANIVTPSHFFHQIISHRSKRCMSQQDIQTDLPQEDKKNWSGKWKDFKTLQQLLIKNHFWSLGNPSYFY